MKRKWFFVGIILILLALVLISVRTRLVAGIDLGWHALAGSVMNGNGAIHNLWGANAQTSAAASGVGSSAVHPGLWGIDSESVDLSALVFSTGALTPAFAPGTITYTQTVANSASSLTVTARPAGATSTITVNGLPVPSGRASDPINLLYGPNPITIVVTASAGIMTKSYTVMVWRWYRLFLPVILH